MSTRVCPPVLRDHHGFATVIYFSVSIHLAMPARVGPPDGVATFRPLCRYAIVVVPSCHATRVAHRWDDLLAFSFSLVSRSFFTFITH